MCEQLQSRITGATADIQHGELGCAWRKVARHLAQAAAPERVAGDPSVQRPGTIEKCASRLRAAKSADDPGHAMRLGGIFGQRADQLQKLAPFFGEKMDCHARNIDVINHFSIGFL
jgi:hypothetical protein